MKALKLSDVIVVIMFMLGIAFAINYHMAYQGMHTAEVTIKASQNKDTSSVVDANKI